MNSKIVRILMAMAFVLPLATLAQTGAAAATSPAASPAPSVPAAATKVGVISIQDAILATNEGQREFEALGKKFEPKRTELKSLNDEVESLQKQLDGGSKTMTEDQRANLVRQIEMKKKTLSRSQEDAQNDFVSQQNEVAQKLLQKLLPVIDKYAKENGLGLIIDSSRQWPDGPVLWAGPSVEITKAIVDLYNSQSGVPAAPSAARPTGAGVRPSSGATRPATKPAEPPK